MRLRLSWHIFFVFFFIIQINDVGSAKMDDESLLLLQLRVENLIEKIINFLQDYYKQIKSDLKCIPEFITTNLIEIIKEAVECVDRNERYFSDNNGTMKHQSKKFLECFTNAKRGVRDMMNSVNTSIDYCPANITEKTYQINVSTIFTKTFRINIRNGVEILKKEIELERDSKHCFDHSSEDGEGEDEGEGEEVPEVDRKGEKDKSKENLQSSEETTEGSGGTEHTTHHSERQKHQQKAKHTIAAHDVTTSTTTIATSSETEGGISGELVKMDPDGPVDDSEEALMKLKENGPENLDDSLVYPDKLGDYDNVEGTLYNEQAEEANLGGYLEYRDSSGVDSKDSDFVIDVVDDKDPDGGEENPEEEVEQEEEEEEEEQDEEEQEEEEKKMQEEEAHSGTSKPQKNITRRTGRVFDEDDMEKRSDEYVVSEDQKPDASATDNMSDTAELE